MLADSGQVFVWGKNNEGQLGLDHTRKVNSIVVLDSIKEPIKTVIAKGNKNFMLSSSGNVFEWPCLRGEEKIHKPTKV